MAKTYRIEDVATGKVLSPEGQWTRDKQDAAVYVNYDEAVKLADEKDALCVEIRKPKIARTWGSMF